MNKYMNSSCSSQQHEQHHDHTHRHAGSGPSSGSALAAGAALQWTCPMHPEILRDAPGDCPVCGMSLVSIAGTGLSGGEEAHDLELRDLGWRLKVGLALSIPLVLVAMAPMMGIHEPFGLEPRSRGWAEFLLGTPVVWWVGWPILRRFWFSLVHRALNMYTLIGLGVSICLPVQSGSSIHAGLVPSGVSGT